MKVRDRSRTVHMRSQMLRDTHPDLRRSFAMVAGVVCGAWWSTIEYYDLRMDYCTCMDYGGGSLPTRPGFEHAMYRGRHRKHQNSLVNLYSSSTAGFVRPSRSCLVSANVER